MVFARFFESAYIMELVRAVFDALTVHEIRLHDMKT